MSLDPDNGLWKKALGFGAGLLVLAGLAWAGWEIFHATPPPPRAERAVTTVFLPPPPLPPPPPPPPPPPREEPPPRKEEMIEQETVSEPEPKPEEPPPVAEAPPADLGTNVQGDGPPDGFGLSGNAAGMGRPGGNGAALGSSSAKNRSKWGWYAGLVQNQIADALRRHEKTKTADLQLKLRIWADAAGRIERVALADSSGNPQLDRALQEEVLAGLVLPEPPPAGMPMPIVLRITARRPG